MSDQFIDVVRADGVATITLNRPETLNSFHRPMASRLQQVLGEMATDESIRAVLLTGAGRAFCAGQDLGAVVGTSGPAEPSVGAIVRDCYNPIVRALRQLPKPVVAAVNGVAAGAGANLALACDIVLAATNASFLQAFSKIGLIPDSGGTYTLPRLVGWGRASALMMLADKVGAAEAAAMGMIYRVYEPEQLLPAAHEMAARLAQLPTRGLWLTKQALDASATNSLAEQLDVEQKLQTEAGETVDYREGVAAFLEKRPPRFVGR